MDKSSVVSQGTTVHSKHFPGALLPPLSPIYSDNHPSRHTVTDSEKLCLDRQQSNSNSHRAELEENPLMVDDVKSSTKVDWTILASCPYESAMQGGVPQTEGITNTTAFPVSELDG